MAVYLITAGCDDPTQPVARGEDRPALSLASVPGAPYQLSDALPSTVASSIWYGLNGHTATQQPYIEASPDGMQRTFEALRGLGGNVYRFDVPRPHRADFGPRSRQTLIAAQQRNVKVIMVLNDHPCGQNSVEPNDPTCALSTDSAYKFGYRYAQDVIQSVMQYQAAPVIAVELGNEMEIAGGTPGVLIGNVAGVNPGDYNDVVLSKYAHFYRGLRQAFIDAGGAIAAIPRLLSSSSGHTHFIRRVFQIAGVTPTASSVDQIAWHWYSSAAWGSSYSTLDTYYVFDDGRSRTTYPSVAAQLFSWFPGGYQLWVTETNLQDPRTTSGACPHDLFGQSVAGVIGPLVDRTASIARVRAVLAYEIFDEDNTASDVQGRFGFAVSGCPAVGNMVGYKASGDSLAAAIYRNRDLRLVLATSLMTAIGGSNGPGPSDTSALAPAIQQAPNKAALFTAVESNVTRRAWLHSLYQRVLRRAADGIGLDWWAANMANGWDRHYVEASFFASDEYFSTQAGGSNTAFVWKLYADVLGRQNDPDGVAYWAWRLDTGTSRFEVARSFLASPEHVDAVVAAVHQQMLGRPATTTEADFWRPRLFSSTTLENMALTLLQSGAAADYGIARRRTAHRT